MSFILNIDTAVQTSSVCLASDADVIACKSNASQKDSAAWLHTAINEILAENSLTLARVAAIAVTEGPGSYTGLRVGMSAAKGLSYTLNKPLITISTLQMMAAAVNSNQGELLCPMIDARRMEVFTAVFDRQLHQLVAPLNLILEPDSFSELLKERTMLFFGNGSTKFQAITTNQHAVFEEVEIDARAMTSLSAARLRGKNFADIAYSQPFYGKDFHTPAK